MNNNKSFITLTIVFEAMSLNRDEGMGNIQTLHLLTRGNGDVYSYMSRQALTYAVRKSLIESGIWSETKVNSGQNVSQYSGDIKEYPEIDLFGYMRTESGTDGQGGSALVRPAAVTFTHAVSLEPYGGDVAFYANPEMARRSGGNPDPYNRQEHRSLYKYSVVIDLNRISKEDNLNNQNSKNAKERLEQLLDAIGSLHHQIAAYREPLYPLFITAAYIKYGSPIFHNYVELSSDKNEKNKINGELFAKGLEHANLILKDKKNKSTWSILEGSSDIHIGITENNNLEKPEELPIDVIEKVKSWVKEIYNTENKNKKSENNG